MKAMRESSLDELNRLLQRNLLRRRDERMEMIGHDDEFVQQIFALRAIVQQGFHEECCGRIVTKDWTPLRSDGCDKKCAIHLLIVYSFEHVGSDLLCFLVRVVSFWESRRSFSRGLKAVMARL